MDDYEPMKLKQSRGPTLEFHGRLLCETSWEARDGAMRLELFETRAGALIPVTRTTFDSGREIVSATVVKPEGLAPADAEPDAAMRFAVLDHFDWNERARSMVRKLGWKLRREVA